MNIIFLCDKEDEEAKALIKSLIIRVKELTLNKDVKCSTKSKLGKCQTTDVIVCVNKGIDEIKEISLSIKDNKKMLVITKEYDEKSIRQLIDICKNITYMNGSITSITREIYFIARLNEKVVKAC